MNDRKNSLAWKRASSLAKRRTTRCTTTAPALWVPKFTELGLRALPDQPTQIRVRRRILLEYLEGLFRILKSKLGLAIGRVGVSEAVIHIGRTGIGQFIEFQDFDRLFGVALLHALIAQQVNGRLREEEYIRVLLPRFLKHLPGARRAARLRQHVPEFCNRRRL